jgi:citrate lyase subunit beta/citryl-CoA lyase
MTGLDDGANSVTWLFVPGDRGDRFERAAASGADEIILDLEDAVAPDAKDVAREAVASWLDGPGAAWVRVNAAGTPGHVQDLTALRGRPGLRGVMVAKAEDPTALAALREQLPTGERLIALVESAAGIDEASTIARSGAVDRLAFGSIDFALDVGSEETDDALLFARSSLVIASRLGALPPPLDGVSASTTDAATTHAAAVRARTLGFGGKLCIHPQQVPPVAEGFRPSEAQLDWARRVLAAAEAKGRQGTFTVGGQMVDRPVLARAQAIIVRGSGPR